MLEVLGLSVFYGGIHALKGISLKVPQGEIVTLIGANGAGKSTTLRTISGLVEARQGKILFRGREIQNRPAHRIVQEGIAVVPEGRRIFVNLSVEENLLMGAYTRKDGEEIKWWKCHKEVPKEEVDWDVWAGTETLCRKCKQELEKTVNP